MKIRRTKRLVNEGRCLGLEEVPGHRPFLPHQYAAFEYARPKQRIALLHEMRLGKTLVAIRWLNKWRLRYERGEAGRVFGDLKLNGSRPRTDGFRALIVAPLSVLSAWDREFTLEKHSGIPQGRCSIRGTRSQKLEQIQAQSTSGIRWWLVNYEGLRASPEIFDLDWQAVVLDESTAIKEPKSQITKLCTREFTRVPLRAILTGTPAPEDLLDYFCQFQFLHSQFLGSSNYWDFRRKYFTPDSEIPGRIYGWQPRPGARDSIKQMVHTLGDVLTRKQANMDVEKVYETRTVELEPKQRKAIKQIKRDFMATIDGKEYKTKWVITQFGWLSRIAGGFTPDGSSLISSKKVDELVRLLSGELRQEQVVVWFRYNSELAIAREKLKSSDVLSASLIGATPPDLRAKRVAAFQSGKYRVLLIQQKLGAYGLDMSAASAAIYYSNWYSGLLRVQSEDRIISVLNKEPKLIVDLITKGSIDEHAVALIREKKLSMKSLSNKLLMKLQEEWGDE